MKGLHNLKSLFRANRSDIEEQDEILLAWGVAENKRLGFLDVNKNDNNESFRHYPRRMRLFFENCHPTLPLEFEEAERETTRFWVK